MPTSAILISEPPKLSGQVFISPTGDPLKRGLYASEPTTLENAMRYATIPNAASFIPNESGFFDFRCADGTYNTSAPIDFFDLAERQIRFRIVGNTSNSGAVVFNKDTPGDSSAVFRAFRSILELRSITVGAPSSDGVFVSGPGSSLTLINVNFIDTFFDCLSATGQAQATILGSTSFFTSMFPDSFIRADNQSRVFLEMTNDLQNLSHSFFFAFVIADNNSSINGNYTFVNEDAGSPVVDAKALISNSSQVIVNGLKLKALPFPGDFVFDPFGLLTYFFDTANAIASGASEDIDIDFPPNAVLSSILSSVDSLARIYVSDTARAADSGRPDGTPPPANLSGFVGEFELLAGTTFFPSPTAWANAIDPQSSVLFMTIFNRAATSEFISVELGAVAITPGD